MTSFSENVKYVNKNCKYDLSNDLGNSHIKGVTFYEPPSMCVDSNRIWLCTY